MDPGGINFTWYFIIFICIFYFKKKIKLDFNSFFQIFFDYQNIKTLKLDMTFSFSKLIQFLII